MAMTLKAVFTLAEKARLVADQLEKAEWLAQDIRVRPDRRVTTLTWRVEVRDSKKGAQQDYFDAATRLCGFYGSTNRYKVPLTCTVDARGEGEEPLVWTRECPYVP